MTNAEEAIMKVFLSGGELFVPCKDKSHQESIRVMAFNIRRKLLPEFGDQIGISKTEEEGKLFIRIYKREYSELYERDPETGKLIPSTRPDDPDTARLVELMQKDGKTPDEIQEILKKGA